MTDAFVAAQIAAKQYGDALDDFAGFAQNAANTGTHIFNPYHNGRHADCVTQTAIYAYTYEDGARPTPELMFSALFHDYDHSGGYADDEWNVNRATDAVRKFRGHPRLVGVDIQVITSNIMCTYFDGTGFPVEPRTLEQKALRDADLMAIYESDAGAQLYGLFRELRVRRPELELKEFIEGNKNFLIAAPMYTKYGNAVKDKCLSDRLAHLEEMLLQAVRSHRIKD